MRRAAILAACLLASAPLWLAPAPAAAVEIQGVVLPDVREVAGRSLRLNGAGLRTKLLFKVYVGGLYVEEPSHDGARIAASTQVRRFELHMLMGLDGGRIGDAIGQGFSRTSGSRLPSLQARLDRLRALFPRVNKGEAVTLTWLPERGTVVTHQGRELGVIEGKDFADALFAVWLDPRTEDKKLRAGLLGI